MPSRLIISIVSSVILLDEPIPNFVQLIGIVLVFVVVSLYLFNIVSVENANSVKIINSSESGDQYKPEKFTNEGYDTKVAVTRYQKTWIEFLPIVE